MAGAAWATVFAQIVSCLMNFARIYYKHPVLHLAKKDMKPSMPIVKKVIGIGIPMAVQNAVESVGMIGVQGVVNTCGTNTIAAFTRAGKIDQIALMPLNSLGMAVSTYVGQNYGKGDKERINQGVKAGVMQSIGIGLALTLIIFSGRRLFAQMFVPASEVDVIAISAEYLGIVAIFYALAGVMNILLNTFRGMGKMTISTVSSCLNPLVKMTAAFLLNMLIGRKALWFAWPVGWLAATIIPAYSYFIGHGVEKALNDIKE